MRSTPVEHLHSFHSSRLSQPPIPVTNENSGNPFRLDHPEFSGLYKPAQTDPSQDSTATHSSVNSSGFGLSPPFLLQPCTKPFSGLPSRCSMTSPQREAGDAARERPGIIYPLLPRAACPDTRVTIEAVLPEAAALDRQSRPPTVLEIAETSLPEICRPQDNSPHGDSHANAVVIARRAFTGRRNTHRPKAAGVNRIHPLL